MTPQVICKACHQLVLAYESRRGLRASIHSTFKRGRHYRCVGSNRVGVDASEKKEQQDAAK